MELQKQILLFFSNLHCTFLDVLVQAMTIMGEEFLLIAIGVFILWNIDKRSGFSICMSLLVASSIMGITKAVVKFPRPWMVINELDVVRKTTATGYSFPSGHTTNASSTYTAIALSFRKRWLSIICAIVIALVGLSRIYLCVHWPMDVACGLIIGCGSSFLLFERFSRLYDDKKKSIRVLFILASIATMIWILIASLLVFTNLDKTAFSDLNIVFALLSGLGFGYALERSKFDYIIEKGCWKKKIFRFVIGMLGVVIILPGLKLLFNSLGLYNDITRALRYALVGLWASGLYPLIGGHLRIFVCSNKKGSSV